MEQLLIFTIPGFLARECARIIAGLPVYPVETGPEWLDELTMKCICEDRDGRYRTVEEIFYTLKTLKNK
jgi:hypothetical protein